MSESRIRTKEVTKNKQHIGWKVYINGSKYPKKPVDFYKDVTEQQAIMKAMQEFRLPGGAGKALITDSCEKPVNIGVVNVLQTDRMFMDSPDAGDPKCLCSRCGLVIPDGIGIIRAWPEIGEGEYRYHPSCLGAVTI
jgi:hypothetical protein